MSPVRAVLLHSPGRKPWVICYQFIYRAPLGAVLFQRMQSHKPNARCECRSWRSSIRFCLYIPRVSYRASPSFHPGLCRSVVPTALIRENLLHCATLTSYCEFWCACPIYVLEHWAYRRGYIQVLLCRTWADPAERCMPKVRVNDEIETRYVIKRPLHNVALAALLSTFRLGHLQE